MARRLNTRLLLYLTLFIGVPVAVGMVAIFSGWLIPSDPGPYLERAREHFEKEEYDDAWVSVRNAMRYGATKDPDAWYLRAKIAMRQAPPAVGDARHSYQSALMFNPDFFDAQRDLAELNVALRDWVQVTKDTARLIEMDPSFGRAYVWAALAEVGVADAEPIYQNRVPHYEAAVKHLLAGIQHAPDLLDLYRLLAQTYLRMEQTEKVDEVLDLAITNNPKMAEAYVLKASRLISQDRVDDAVEVLRQGLEKAEDHAVLLLALGEAAARKNENDSAKEFFKKAISADPKIEAGYLRLAMLYRIEAEPQAALDLLEQGLKALPDSVPLKVEQADIHLELRNVEKADALIKEVSETTPDAAMVDYLQGKRALLDGGTRQAITYLERARDKSPTPRIQLLLGHAYLGAGELGVAEEQLESVVLAQPSHLGARRALAKVQLRLRRYDNAVRNATAVLDARPDDVAMRLLLAQAYWEQGKPGRALQEAQAAAEGAQDNPRPLLLVADIYQKMEQLQNAEDALRRALATGKEPETVHRELIRFYQATDQKAKLEAAVEEARKVLPDAPWVWMRGSFGQLEEELKQHIQEGPFRVSEVIALARLYELTNRGDEAQTLLEKALAQTEVGSEEWRRVRQPLFLRYLDSRAYAKAADLIAQLQKADPNAPELLFADPLMELSQNRPDEAAQQLRAIVEEHPTLSSGYYLLGQVLAQQRQWEAAAAQLQTALRVRPDLVSARLLLGRIYLQQGNYTAALVEAREALKFSPSLIPALELEAMAHVGEKGWDDAIEARERIAELVGTNVGNLAALASLYLQRDNPAKAEETFQAAYEIAPDNAALVRRFAEFYVRTERPEKGKTLADEYLSRHENEAAAHVLRGEIAAMTDGMAEAEKDYRKAAKLSPDNVVPLILLGNQYSSRGRWADAARVYREALEREKDNVQAKKHLADVCMLQNKLEEASAIIQEVLEAEPKDAQALVVAGRIAARRKNAKEAAEFMMRALEAAPTYGEARFRLAELYETDDPPRALDLLAGVDPSDSAFEKAMSLRSSINVRRGQLNDAVMDLERLIEFRPMSENGCAALAQLYMTMRKPARAAAVLEPVVRRQKGPGLLVALGNTLLAQERYAEALERYEQARSLKPELPGALIGEARCLVLLDRSQEALDRVQHMVNQFEVEAWPRLALVAVYQMTRQPDKAIETLRNGLLKHPDWEEGYVRLAAILSSAPAEAEGEGAREQARQVLLDGLRRLPDSLHIRTMLANLEFQAGRTEQAKKTLDPIAEKFEAQYGLLPEERARLRAYVAPMRLYALLLYRLGQIDEAVKWGTMVYDLEPLDVDNANNLAWILATERDNLERAVRLIRRAIEFVPNNPQILDTAGWIAFLQEDYEQATYYLLESIRLGDIPEARYHLGRTYERRDRPEDAIREYSKALELGLLGPDRQDARKRLEQLRRRVQP